MEKQKKKEEKQTLPPSRFCPISGSETAQQSTTFHYHGEHRVSGSFSDCSECKSAFDSAFNKALEEARESLKIHFASYVDQLPSHVAPPTKQPLTIRHGLELAIAELQDVHDNHVWDGRDDINHQLDDMECSLCALVDQLNAVLASDDSGKSKSWNPADCPNYAALLEVRNMANHYRKQASRPEDQQFTHLHNIANRAVQAHQAKIAAYRRKAGLL
jgi:hypothetical protein